MRRNKWEEPAPVSDIECLVLVNSSSSVKFPVGVKVAASIFFFNDTATTENYTLSLHDALPIWPRARRTRVSTGAAAALVQVGAAAPRSEEHTSELQSQSNLVCRLLLEKKN